MSRNANRLNAFAVRKYEVNGEERSEWIRLGVAFPHDDGKGYNIQLTAFPVDGKLVLREPKPEDEQG